MRVRIYERGNQQYLDFRDGHGIRRRVSVTKYFGNAANDALLEVPVQESVKIEEAVQEYVKRCSNGTENRYGIPKSRGQAVYDALTLQRLAARHRGRYVHEISDSDLRDYFADRANDCRPHKGSPLSVATLNRELAVFKSFFRFCVNRKHCRQDPAAGLKKKPEHNLRSSWAATESEVARWREQLTGTLLDIFDTLVGTAMRVGEVLRLRPCDYDAVHYTLLLAHPKEQRPAEVPVNSHVQGIVEARLNGQWLFPSGKGKPYTVSGIRSLLYRARDRAGLREYTVHDLRRTAATAMLNAGVDIRRIQAVLRHRKLDTTMRYLGIRPEGLNAAVEAISGFGMAQKGHTEENLPVSDEAAEVDTRPLDCQSSALPAAPRPQLKR